MAEKVYSLGHGLHFHYPVYFASDLMNILSEMNEVQPLVFLATPRSSMRDVQVFRANPSDMKYLATGQGFVYIAHGNPGFKDAATVHKLQVRTHCLDVIDIPDSQ